MAPKRQGAAVGDLERHSSDAVPREETSHDQYFSSSEVAFPVRKLHRLFASSETVHCALHERCVPCAYKIACFDVALDKEFSSSVPNKRPESCPRSKGTNHESVSYLGYEPGMRVLSVGDGDFSFSLGVARKIRGDVIATSYEDLETLRGVYPDFDETVAELKSLNSEVYYNVDATQLDKTLPEISSDEKFDRICWNFPCTAILNGQDGQNDAMEQNKQLVRDFVKNAIPRLKDDGQIHMCHKTKPPYDQWDIEEVVTSADANVSFLGRVVLDRFCLLPYTPRKALDKKSFPCHDACVYVIGFDASRRFPPQNTVAVTADLVAEIRQAHLQHTTTNNMKTRKRKKQKKQK